MEDAFETLAASAASRVAKPGGKPFVSELMHASLALSQQPSPKFVEGVSFPDYREAGGTKSFPAGALGRRAALERAISGAAQEARRQNRSVVLFHMCSYPCGYPPEVAPTLPPGVARGPGNHPDLLQFVDAVERPRTAEGDYGEGGARAAVLLLRREPAECVASTTGKSGSRDAFQAYALQTLGLQSELVFLHAQLAALPRRQWAILDYGALATDMGSTLHALLRWVGANPAAAGAVATALGARLRRTSADVAGGVEIWSGNELSSELAAKFSVSEMDLLQHAFYSSEARRLWPLVLQEEQDVRRKRGSVLQEPVGVLVDDTFAAL